MWFWLIITVLALAVALTVVLPLWRGSDGSADPAQAMAIYRDQLAEVERDLARGVLDEAEAARTRTEVARRILSADKARTLTQADAPIRLSQGLAAGLAFALITGAGALYFALGAPGYPDVPLAQRHANADAIRAGRIGQAEAETMMPTLPPADLPADYVAMVDQLRTTVQARPDDLEGWTLLSLHEAQSGNFAAAALAQARVITLKGAAVSNADVVALLDRMVAATNGYVSPEAEAAARAVLERDPANAGALYYIGLLYAQTDRPDIAFGLWRQVVEAPGAAGIHYELAFAQIADAAFAAGVDYAPPAATGPTAAEVAAATEMTPEDQTAMIEGMVAGLAERLGADGGPPSDWARLIASYGVLGQLDAARAIWAEAQVVFADDPAALDILSVAATSAGVAE
jgi:cytochrome c-type biogenesis protein CcmH